MSPKFSRRPQDNHEGENGDTKPSSSALVKISENMTELELPLKILNDRITCILCKGYFVEATTVLDCLHTFCKSCLLNHFDKNENTCPKCNTLIHQSHPTHYVSFDRTLQDIVYKLVPGMQEEEMRRREEYEANRTSESETSDEDSIPKLTPSMPVTDNGLEEDKNSEDCCLKDPCSGHHREEEPILVILENHKQLAALDRPLIRLPGMATVNTVKRYISLILRGSVGHYQDYDIFCNDELMGRDFSMAFIYKTRWRNQSSAPMQLIYRPHCDY